MLAVAKGERDTLCQYHLQVTDECSVLQLGLEVYDLQCQC